MAGDWLLGAAGATAVKDAKVANKRVRLSQRAGLREARGATQGRMGNNFLPGERQGREQSLAKSVLKDARSDVIQPTPGRR